MANSAGAISFTTTEILIGGMTKKLHLSVFVLLITLLVSAQKNQGLKMSEFIGINSNVAAYDQKYLADLAKCTKWMREYHSWAHYEAADNYYKWDNITTQPQGYTWPDHNKFMDQCRALGINVLIDVLNKPSWAGSDRGAYSTGDGSKATDYLDRLEFVGQLVARYGSRKIDPSKLETADKVTGLNYIKYYEDDNEPDYWWETPRWPAEKYAVYCNAVHDGYGVEPSDEYPLLGIKSVDSSAVHVLAGMSGDLEYLQKILNNSNGRIPFDVLNIHTYCTDHINGYSPENENYGLEKKLEKFMDWRQRTLPEVPVWITEFGWDTYILNNFHSYVYAPPPQQANYILRSYFILLKMGFEKAFLFMDKDPNSKSTVQYSSSGILTDQGAGLQKKPSYYYLATLQHVLGEAVFNRVVSFREPVENNEVYCFEFLNGNTEKIYALWTRRSGSKTDSGLTMHYSFDLGYQPEYGYIIHPKDKDLDGEKNTLEITGNNILLNLSETPQFLVVSQKATSSEIRNGKSFDFRIYPNPAHGHARIRIENPESQRIQVSAYSANGAFEGLIADRFFNEGVSYLEWNESRAGGVYFIKIQTAEFSRMEKIVIN